MHVVLKALLRARGRRVARDLGGVLFVFAPQGVRPGAVFHLRNGADVKRGQHARRRCLIAQQRFLDNTLDGDERDARGRGEQRKLALAADPHIAEPISFGRMEQANVRTDRRDCHDRIVLLVRILDHGPSGRVRRMSLPIRPRMGMKGTPFCAAIRPVSMAGQVASMMRIACDLMARVNDGAPPASPRLTALVSMVETRPAPISMSTCKPPTGAQIRCRSLAPFPMMNLVRPTEAPEPSGGAASSAPGFIFAAIASGVTNAVIGLTAAVGG